MGDALGDGWMGGDFEAGAMVETHLRTPSIMESPAKPLPTVEAEEEARWKVHCTPTRVSPNQSELSIGCRPLR